MKKRIVSLLLTVLAAFGLLAGCNDDSSSSPSIEEVDYAASVTLDMSSETLKQEATVKLYIDGDTTHFNVPASISDNGVLKARYIAINTPESTGKIEEWGKKASNFTKSKLKSATSIILETDGTVWDRDSTGDRHLVWVWYKPEGSATYRNLNIEILQNGLAIASNSEGNRYGEVCGKAISQATALKLNVHSTEKDPDFYYGDAQPVDLKELRLNLEAYNGTKVSFEGVVTYLNNNGAYVENYDEETDIWYGMYVYYGFSLNAFGQEVLFPGHKVRVVGTVSYYEAGDSYQVSGVDYNVRNPDDPNSMKDLGEEGVAYSPVSLETTIEKFNGTVEIELQDEDASTTYAYAELAMQSSISMKGLRVVDTYTTNNGGDSDGAITLTCEDGDGNEITVRTIVLKDENGKIVTADKFMNKTIDVKGVIDYFKSENSATGSYQIKVFNMENITIR
ncbi:MAG: thermonuclease family protein [Clostridia bacterium]|nr:thermonuclease family protein [Clostridia bacterium]